MNARPHVACAVAIAFFVCGCELLSPPRGPERSTITSGSGQSASSGATGTTGSVSTGTTGSSSGTSTGSTGGSASSSSSTGGSAGGWCVGGHPQFIATPSFINVPGASSGARPTDFVVGDFNGDGKPDLAEINTIVNSSDPNVYVFPGTGNGRFDVPDIYAAASIPASLASGDFNGDGIPDLAVADPNSHVMNFIFGLRDGGFQQGPDAGIDPAGQVPIGPETPLRMVAGSLDGKRRSALVMADSNSIAQDIGVLRGAADAGFALDQYGALDPIDVALGDFNGDHKLDIAFIDDGGAGMGILKLLMGNGDGTFRPTGSQYPIFNFTALTAADIDGDGLSDVIMLHGNSGSAGGSVVFWPGESDGGLAPRPATAIPSDPAATTIPTWIGASDLNGDGITDLMVLHLCTANCGGAHKFMSVLLGQGSGQFDAEFSYPLIASSQRGWIADLNNDGRPDLIFLSRDNSTFNVLLQSGCLP